MNYDRAFDTLPKIIIDHRERQSGLYERLKAVEIFDVEEGQLESADIVIHRLGIERKTGQDLAAPASFLRDRAQLKNGGGSERLLTNSLSSR